MTVEDKQFFSSSGAEVLATPIIDGPITQWLELFRVLYTFRAVLSFSLVVQVTAPSSWLEHFFL